HGIGCHVASYSSLTSVTCPGSFESFRPASFHSQRGLVEVEDSFLFLTLGCILLAQADDGAQRLGVETGAFCLGKDVLDVVGDGLLLFLKTLDALDERAQLARGNGLAGFGDLVGHSMLRMKKPRLGAAYG